jgi:hypothetical protein
MTRQEIIQTFRRENPEITERVLTNPVLESFCLEGNKDVCSRTRCIVDEDGSIISTSEGDQRFDLTVHVSNFYDIDEFPGSGVLYNNKRLTKTSMADLDTEDESWRNRTGGTPKKYYRRGKWLCLDRPIDSNEEDIKVYAVLKPDDFDADSKTPYNELDYLEPFHYGIVKYLQWKAKEKVGKGNEGTKAESEYLAYIEYMKKMLGGGKFSPIRFIPRTGTTKGVR